MEKLRSSVRPVLTYLFCTVFVGLAIYSFIKYGNTETATTILMGFTGAAGIIIGMYFQSRNNKPTEK
jgi:uncharacterized membrane protein YfcA